MGGDPDTVETRFGRVRPSPVSSKSAAASSHRTAAGRRCRVISDDDDSPMDGVAEGAACEAPPAPSPEPTGTPPTAASRRSSPAVSQQQPPRPCSSSAAVPLDMEADISLLQPVTFSTIQRAPPEPMLRLSWHHKVNLIGEPVLNPLIHVCEMCDCPILSYGRMIPCKHVFCYDCAVSQDKCGHCGDRLVRVERAGLGKLFLCLQDGKRYNNSGCRRTYLSQRDLQAHINHRHRRQAGATSAEKSSAVVAAAASRQDSSTGDHRAASHHESASTRAAAADPRTLHDDARQQRDPRAGGAFAARAARHQPPPQPIPVMTTQRSGNLISIPLQGHHPPPPPPPPQYAAAPPAFYQTTPPPPAAGAVVYNRNYPPAQYPSPWGTLPPAALSHPPPRYYH